MVSFFRHYRASLLTLFCETKPHMVLTALSHSPCQNYKLDNDRIYCGAIVLHWFIFHRLWKCPALLTTERRGWFYLLLRKPKISCNIWPEYHAIYLCLRLSLKHNMHPALGVLFVCFISCFTHSPRRFVLCDGMEESTLRRFSGLKPDRHLSVTGHRICSAACVLYYDIHHMAACH